MIGSVLVVCTGNICRSPAGERMLARICADLRVSSAGLGALVGAPADQVTFDVAKAQYGLDLSGHIARSFTAELGSSHDLILAMDRHHRLDIMRHWPALSGRVMLFDHWSGAEGIDDPFRRAADVHARILGQIERAALAWSQRLGRAGGK